MKQAGRCSLRGAWLGFPPENQKNKLSVPQLEAECGHGQLTTIRYLLYRVAFWWN